METVSSVERVLVGLSHNELLCVIDVLKHQLQALIAAHNLRGDQAAAHEISKQLCEVLAIEFKFNPRSRRSRGGF
jgi:hypothetical protein